MSLSLFVVEKQKHALFIYRQKWNSNVKSHYLSDELCGLEKKEKLLMEPKNLFEMETYSKIHLYANLSMRSETEFCW